MHKYKFNGPIVILECGLECCFTELFLHINLFFDNLFIHLHLRSYVQLLGMHRTL